MRLSRHKRLSIELRPISSQGHHLLHRERRYHYPKEALGVHYAEFDLVLPAWSPKSYTSTTPGPVLSESKMASTTAQALEAFDRLSDLEKTKVLAYLFAGHPHKAVQVTERKELPLWMMLAALCLLIFTFCGSWACWAITLTSAQ